MTFKQSGGHKARGVTPKLDSRHNIQGYQRPNHNGQIPRILANLRVLHEQLATTSQANVARRKKLTDLIERAHFLISFHSYSASVPTRKEEETAWQCFHKGFTLTKEEMRELVT